MPSVESLSVCLCSSRCDLGTSILHKVRQPHSHTYLMPAQGQIYHAVLQEPWSSLPSSNVTVA